MDLKLPSGLAGAVTRVINEAFEVIEMENTSIVEVREVEDLFHKLKIRVENLENAHAELMSKDLSEEQSEKLSEWMEEKTECISEKRSAIRKWLNEQRALLKDSDKSLTASNDNALCELLKEHNETSAILARNQTIAMLPPKELEPFDGDHLKFSPFLRAFNQVIVERVSNYVDRMP